MIAKSLHLFSQTLPQSQTQTHIHRSHRKSSSFSSRDTPNLTYRTEIECAKVINFYFTEPLGRYCNIMLTSMFFCGLNM